MAMSCLLPKKKNPIVWEVIVRGHACFYDGTYGGFYNLEVRKAAPKVVVSGN